MRRSGGSGGGSVGGGGSEGGGGNVGGGVAGGVAGGRRISWDPPLTDSSILVFIEKT